MSRRLCPFTVMTRGSSASDVARYLTQTLAPHHGNTWEHMGPFCLLASEAQFGRLSVSDCQRLCGKCGETPWRYNTLAIVEVAAASAAGTGEGNIPEGSEGKHSTSCHWGRCDWRSVNGRQKDMKEREVCWIFWCPCFFILLRPSCHF